MKRNTTRSGFKVAILVLIVLVCAYLFAHSSVFNLKAVEINGNEKVSRDEIIALSGLSNGINIFKVNRPLTAKTIEIHPMIKKVEIIRHLPSTIEVCVTERKGWALIPFQESFLVVDNEGICFDRLNTLNIGNYPLITLEKVPDRVNLGQAVDRSATSMIRKVWDALPQEQRNQLSEFHYSNKKKTLLIYTLKGTEVRFGNLERLDEKVETFSEIFKIEDELEKKGDTVLEYVDIQYKGQPVVKTAI